MLTTDDPAAPDAARAAERPPSSASLPRHDGSSMRAALSSRLGRRLLFWILLIGGVNALVATSIQLFVDYRRDLADLAGALTIIEDSLVPGLVEAAWNFDSTQLEVQLDGIVRLPWVAGALIRYGPAHAVEAHAGTVAPDHPGARVYPLVRPAGARDLRIGELIVAPNLDTVYRRTLERVGVVLATQVGKALVISVSLLILFATLVTRHLERMAAFARTFAPARGFSPLELTRPRQCDADELTDLVASLNSACGGLAAAHWREVRHRVQLEEQVAARTRDLEAARNRLALSLEAGRLGVWEWEFATDRLIVDERWAGMLGFEVAEIDPHLESFRRLAHPDDLTATFAAVADHVDGRTKFYRAQFRLRTKAGGWRTILSGGMVVERAPDRRPLRMIGVHQDITDRVFAEQQVRDQAERTRIILDTVVEGIVTVDADDRIATVNPAAERLFETPADELIGRSVALVLPRLGAAADPGTGAPAATGGRLAAWTGRRHETVGWTRTGAEVPLDIGVAEARIGGDRTFTVSLHDISLHKEAARAKQEFVSKVSHEVRTPMNAVVGLTLLALRTELTDKQRDYLCKIYASSQTLLAIINDILDYSKIEAGRLELHLAPFGLDQVLDTVATLVSVAAAEKGLELLFAVDPATPYSLVGDAMRLEQVLVNLANNAVKFTEVGEVVIAVAPTGCDDTGSDDTAAADRVWLEFSVRDTGIGLSRDQIDRLFVAFTQADGSVTRRFGGTGLGLAICRQLVELMGGRIRADGAPGVGSTFRFTVPLGRGPDARDRRRAPDDLGGKRVLVIDDSQTSREVLETMLASHGFEVATAEDGFAGIAALERASAAGRPFDLVLMDWHMPGPNGTETARRIRADARLSHIPAILMVTAFGREEVMREAGELGLDGFLIKPVTDSLLLETVTGIFAGRGPGSAVASPVPGAARVPSIPVPPAILAGARVLLVEDNAINREIVHDLLGDAGALVDTAVTGREALARLRDDPYDAVLMDIEMPVMDGLSAIRALRAEPGLGEVPVIAMTAQAMAGDRERSLAAGMNDHITKPIDPAHLYVVLAQWIGARSGGPVPPPPLAALPQPTPAGATRGPAAHSSALPALVGFDLAEALRLNGGEPARLKRMVQDFRRLNASLAAVIADRFATRNLDELVREAHSLKSSASYIGARELADAAAAVDAAAQRVRAAGADDPALGFLVARLTGSLDRALAAIDGAVAWWQTPAETPDGTGPADPAAVRALIDRLAPMVAEGNFAADALIDQLQILVAKTALSPLVARLRQRFDQLDLAAVAEDLAELRRWVG